MFTPVPTPVAGIPVQTGTIQEITCYKNEGQWYIGLAQYVMAKGQQACTEIAALTDDLMQWIARKRSRFTVKMHTKPFEGAGMLELDELCTGPEGGAYYRMPLRRNGAARRLWVCDTSLLVFGDLPPRIFFRVGVAQ